MLVVIVKPLVLYHRGGAHKPHGKVLSRVESLILQQKGVYKDCGTKALCSSSSSRYMKLMKLMKLDFGGVLGK
jgi:hypothetical protein